MTNESPQIGHNSAQFAEDVDYQSGPLKRFRARFSMGMPRKTRVILDALADLLRKPIPA